MKSHSLPVLLWLAAILPCADLIGQPSGATTAPASLKDAPANTWVRLADGPGPRTSFGLVYTPKEDRFVCFGGAMEMDPEKDKRAVNSPYSELTLDLDKGVWENRFPTGKESWGPAVGPVTKAPPFPGSYYAFKMKDAEGNGRAYLGAGYYNAMWLWGNYAFDSHRGRVVTYWTLAHQMAEYDVAGRTWEPTTSAATQPQDFRDGMLFGCMCYDPVNKEIVGGQGRWAFKDGTWRKLELAEEPKNKALRERAEDLRRRAADLAGACRARYFLAETDEEAKIRLDEIGAKLNAEFQALVYEILPFLNVKSKKEPATEKELLDASAKKFLDKITPESIERVEAGRDMLDQGGGRGSPCPPKRAHSRMVYDEANRKIVLFGGDALDRLLGDTWVYDCERKVWACRLPKVSPAPRAGHKLLYLPKAKKVLLIDGYGYDREPGRPRPRNSGPEDGPAHGAEAWVYDTAKNEWQLLKEGGISRGAIPTKDWYPMPAAATDDDVVVTFARNDKGEVQTIGAKIDATLVDIEGTKRLGVPPLTEKFSDDFRQDPQWYDTAATQPDPAAEEKVLKDLPANTWTMRQSPNWPKIDYGISRCWGTCAIDTDRDELLHFGGGHGTYDGNDVLHYSIRANRYYIGYRPEHGLNFAPNGIGIPVCQSYKGRPMISCHTYHCYTYDPTLHKLVFVGTRTEDRVFTYDPLRGDWDLTLGAAFGKNGFDLRQWQYKCTPTPKGVVAWAGSELWRVNAAKNSAKNSWDRIPADLKGFEPGWDESGITYDSKRDRLLILSAGLKGDVLAVPAAGGEVKHLAPAGRASATAACREIVYLPDADCVLVAAHPSAGPGDGPARWLVYDCAKNAWAAAAFAGVDPIGKERFNVSLGLMYDPRRHLVWAMDILSRPHVLKFDPAAAAADIRPIQDAPGN